LTDRVFTQRRFRKDLGIWLLRECLPGYEFVASARRCKTVRSVKRQQELCGSDNSTQYQFCPSKTGNEYLIEEIREAPRQCACPNGERNCVCPSPEILEPVVIPINSERARRAPSSSRTSNNQRVFSRVFVCSGPISNVLFTQQPLQFSQYQSCPCPSAQPACTCVSTNSQSEKVLVSVSCCTQPSSTPCQCPSPVDCQTTTTQQQYCPQQQPAIVQPQGCPLDRLVQSELSVPGAVGLPSGPDRWQSGESERSLWYPLNPKSSFQCMVCCYFRRKSRRV
uniref:Thyroglobulin type-1 domain-containing protein n=1 Tax=Nippostrongylus brasiliensis TaxID=27835 RepID=A0A0N4YB00_NIPBR